MVIQLRPSTFDGIIGNAKLKQCLGMNIAGAKQQKRPVGHLLLQGHYGCGKTTFARAIANAMGGQFIETNALAIKKPKDLLGYLRQLKENDILFIDEIHQLQSKHEELMYPAMEDFKFPLSLNSDIRDQLIKTGATVNINDIINLKLPPFTLIGATTDIGSLSGPLLSRFELNYFVDLYTVEEINKIVMMNAKKLNIAFDQDGSMELARRCKLVPRLSNNRLKWVADYAAYNKKTHLNQQDVVSAMDMMEIDEFGYDRNDRAYIDAVQSMQPTGVASLAAKTGITIETITKFIEPYLLHTGVIKITREGRMMFDFNAQHLMGEIETGDLE